MSRIYTTPLPKSQITRNDEATQARVQQSGLLQEGGTATEKIASENIDVTVDGIIRFGSKFSEKLARELESLGESKYEALPFFDPDISGGGPSAGYYEVERVDVSPVQSAVTEAYQYSVGLAFNETRESAWRAISTNEESISTGLATGSSSNLGIPALAAKARWFDAANGTEPATATSTVSGEFGDIDLYDPDNATGTDPYLLYEISYEDESPVDVRVYDDGNQDKYYRTGGRAYGTGDYGSGDYGTSVIASQWTHAYHTSFEFEGRPVVDNGLLRVIFDEPNGQLEFYRHPGWQDYTPTQTDYDLVDADLTRIGPAMVEIDAEFQKTDNSLENAILRVQRGLTNMVLRQPDNGTLTTDLENMLSPIVSDNTTDVQPTNTLKPRSEVK